MSELHLTGRWIMLQVTATLSRVAVVGRVRASTRSVVLYDVVHRDGRLRGEGRLLHMQIDNGRAPVKIRIPDAFRRAIPPSNLNAEIRTEADGRVRLVQPRAWTVLGAKLEDPIHEPLPTGANDPRVWDQDEDGHPGVTIHVDGMVRGDIYVIQRSWSALDGVQTAPDAFKGKVTFGQEQVILGASNVFLKTAPRNTPDPKRSMFQMVRVAPNATDSEALAV
ncbi:MAG: hypothetical protein AAFS10_26920, partial [Myxococcota bacterium]